MSESIIEEVQVKRRWSVVRIALGAVVVTGIVVVVSKLLFKEA